MVTERFVDLGSESGCACRTVLPSDLQFLTDEDLEEIGRLCCRGSAFMADLPLLYPTGGALTRVEKKRLQAAVQAQRGAPHLLSRHHGQETHDDIQLLHVCGRGRPGWDGVKEAGTRTCDMQNV